MLKCASQCSESIQITNSSPSYVSSLVTSFSSLQTRRAVRSSTKADFVAHNHLENIKIVHLHYSCTRLYRTSFRTLFENLHQYCFVKLTSIHRLLVQDLLRLSIGPTVAYALLCKMLFFKHATNDS